MALGYAFIDEQGVRHGETHSAPPARTFEYVPHTGPFAGQRLIVYASSWDGVVSNTRLSTARYSCHATARVEELLGMDSS